MYLGSKNLNLAYGCTAVAVRGAQASTITAAAHVRHRSPRSRAVQPYLYSRRLAHVRTVTAQHRSVLCPSCVRISGLKVTHASSEKKKKQKGYNKNNTTSGWVAGTSYP